MSAPIKGIVIKILDDYSVILNVGQENGVKQGMVFAIYAEGEEILDYATRKVLGKYERVKARVTVVHAQEKFSTAQSIEKEIISPMASAIQSLRGEFTVVKKLPVDEHQIEPVIVPDDSKIRLGDKVKQILE